jgi:hypothetical protein
MRDIPTRASTAAFRRTAALTLIAAAVLSACGGGGGDPGAVPAAGSTGGTGGTTPVVPTTPATTETKVSVVMVDAAGNPVGNLSGAQTATLKATVLTPAGKPAAGAIVQFAAATQDIVVFTPETGSALTDANGVASVTIRPATVTASGAVAISATSVVEGKTGTAGLNLAVSAAPLTLGALAFSPARTGVLPAFSAVSLNIPVSSAGQPVNAAPGLSLTSLCVAAGSATLVPGAISGGVQQATYTNNGCTLGTDRITASIGGSTQTLDVPVGMANIGSIDFTSSSLSTSSIVLKGNGGQGRAEAATLTFRVLDQQGNPLSGVDVDFNASTYTGGLTVSPMRARTDASGNVSTIVTSGTIPTPVRILASASRNGANISGLSDTLIVSTGLPIAKSMSLGAEFYNFEADGYDNETIDMTVLLADQYGNPVSDNTAVNFVTEGGAVGTSALGGCMTKDGGCTVPLRSQEFRPLDGRVTVLAYAQGIETFTDLNGDGQYTCINYVDADGKVPAVYLPLVHQCQSGGEPFDDLGDAFLDANWDNTYDAAVGDRPFPYNHATYTSEPNKQWGLNYIRRSVEVIFSGSFARLTRQVCTNAGCRDWAAADGNPAVIQGAAGNSCTPQQLAVRIADKNNNPMPNETTVTVVATHKLTASAVAPAKIASTNALGGTTHFVTVTPDASCAAGDITLQVKTPKGNMTDFKFTAN